MKAIRYLVTSVTFAACFASTQAWAAPPSYHLVVVAGANSAAYGINKYGHTVGYMTVSGNQHAFRNIGAGAKDLGTLGGASSSAWGINDHDRVVGQAENGSGNTRAFFSNGVTLFDLGTLGGANSYGRAINNDGTMVGFAELADGRPRAFSFSNGAMANLGALPSTGETYSYAEAINEVGLIGATSSAGAFTPPEPPVHAALRRTSGKMIDLGTFGGQFSETLGLNDKGEAVGIAATSMLHFDNAFLYSGGVKKDIGNLGGGYAQANDINNRSQVVGSSAGSMPSRGFLYQGGSMVALDTLLVGTSGWTIVDARAINDRGQIAGTGCKATVCYAVRLDPIY
jgi:probable HAF family extracellular repeat protein